MAFPLKYLLMYNVYPVQTICNTLASHIMLTAFILNAENVGVSVRRGILHASSLAKISPGCLSVKFGKNYMHTK